MSDQSIDELSEAYDWLSLSQAAALLGVHPMTLRRWSDSGRLPVYRTPGGHRRFARADIEAYLTGQREEIAVVKEEEVDIQADWADQALVQTRQKVAQDDRQRWLEAIDDDQIREQYRLLSHKLMGLLLQYVAAEEPDESFLREAKRLGQQYGAYGRRADLSLTYLLEATLFFRDILVESSLQAATSPAQQSTTSLRLLKRINKILNTVQLAIADYYEQG